jgi:hypothetical protein
LRAQPKAWPSTLNILAKMPHGRMTFGQLLGRQKMAEAILFSIENSFSKKWEDIFFRNFFDQI